MIYFFIYLFNYELESCSGCHGPKKDINFSEDSTKFSVMHSKHGKITIKVFKDHFKLSEHENYFVVDYLL